jgi:uncharacterized protein (UPF0332 family)
VAARRLTTPALHLAKTGRSLHAVRVLLAADLPEQATSDACHAAFHAATALLASAGVEAGTHEGLRRLLALHFVKDGPLPPPTARDLSRLLSDRLLADYAVAGEIDLAAAFDAARLANGLVRAMLPVLLARDPASAAAAEAVRREADLLDQAAA